MRAALVWLWRAFFCRCRICSARLGVSFRRRGRLCVDCTLELEYDS